MKLAPLLAVILGMAGCKNDDVSVDMTNLQGPPGSSLAGDDVKIQSGTALIVEAHPKAGDEASTEAVELVASEPFTVLKTATKNRFVISADRAGHGTIRVTVQSKDVRTLQAVAE